MSIKGVKAREILDSRGYPTIEVEILTAKGIFRADVPSGTSTGKFEAHELRDNQKKRYDGKGVKKAITAINNISKKLIGMDPKNQKEIDMRLINLDGTIDKSSIGANALLGISIAVCKAGAAESNMPLFEYIKKISENKKIKMPTPLMLVLEGGSHANNSSDIQEFMIIPKAKNCTEKIRKGTEVYYAVKEMLEEKKFSTNVGYEGAFASPFEKNERVFELLTTAIHKSKFAKKDFSFAIDMAASELYDKKMKRYIFSAEKKSYDENGLINYYNKLQKKFHIMSIEDGFEENDWKSWKDFTKKTGKKLMIVGDDFLATNPARIRKAIQEKRLC